MRINGWMIVAVLLFVCGSAEPVWAWGPATHIGLSTTILDHLYMLPAAVAAIIARNRSAYLYGSIAADVVFAKRWSRVKQSCHHWSTGFRLLESAHHDDAKAFAYGYLSHLAADTVAHGKFVPRQVAVSGVPVNLGHLYWELRADSTESDAHWKSLECVLCEDRTEHHRLLGPHMTETFLPFVLNLVLFDGMNALSVRKGFRTTVRTWNRHSRWCLTPSLISGYRSESVDRIVAILSEGQRSSLLLEDPNGTSALMQLRVQRRQIRRFKRRGLPVEQRVLEAARGWAPKPTSAPSAVAIEQADGRRVPVPVPV